MRLNLILKNDKPIKNLLKLKNKDDSFSTNQERQYRPSIPSGPPSRTIMMRQLPLTMGDYELKNELTALGVPFKDIRLVKNRDTGTSRGFAFIEFGTIEEAQSWVNQTQVSALFMG